MLISISLTCVSGDGYIQTERTGPPYDIYHLLYNNVILQFIRMVSIMLWYYLNYVLLTNHLSESAERSGSVGRALYFGKKGY